MPKEVRSGTYKVMNATLNISTAGYVQCDFKIGRRNTSKMKSQNATCSTSGCKNLWRPQATTTCLEMKMYRYTIILSAFALGFFFSCLTLCVGYHPSGVWTILFRLQFYLYDSDTFALYNNSQVYWPQRNWGDDYEDNRHHQSADHSPRWAPASEPHAFWNKTGSFYLLVLNAMVIRSLNTCRGIISTIRHRHVDDLMEFYNVLWNARGILRVLWNLA